MNSEEAMIAARIRHAEERVRFFSWFLAIAAAPIVFSMANLDVLISSGLLPKIALSIALISFAFALSVFIFDLAASRSFLMEILRIQARTLPDVGTTVRQLREFADELQAKTDSKRFTSMALFPMAILVLVAGYFFLLASILFALWTGSVGGAS
jgi:hypothetical protein